jgi:hypothetical protein
MNSQIYDLAARYSHGNQGLCWNLDHSRAKLASIRDQSAHSKLKVSGSKRFFSKSLIDKLPSGSS